jgi:aryl-alcohol dehydrogenase-like predicted oxidoreductase
MERRDFIKSVVAAGIAAQLTPAIAQRTPTTPPTAAPAASTPITAEGMPRRKLGKTGVEVSAMVLGGAIGMWLAPSATHDPTGIAELALNLGITYFDTAPSYRDGQSEKNFGPVVGKRRKEIFLASKAETRGYDRTMKDAEESLKRLQTDHLDLLQVHSIQPKEEPEKWDKPDGVITALRKLRDQKMIRFIGITGHMDAGMLQKCIDMYEFDTLLTTLNATPRRKPFREELLPHALQKNMGVIAMKVMGGGYGALVTGNPLKKVIQPYQDMTDNQVEFHKLIRYTMSLPCTCAVMGVANPEQLKANVAIVKAQNYMTAAERAELEKVLV